MKFYYNLEEVMSKYILFLVIYITSNNVIALSEERNNEFWSHVDSLVDINKELSFASSGVANLISGIGKQNAPYLGDPDQIFRYREILSLNTQLSSYIYLLNQFSQNIMDYYGVHIKFPTKESNYCCWRVLASSHRHLKYNLKEIDKRIQIDHTADFVHFEDTCKRLIKIMSYFDSYYTEE